MAETDVRRVGHSRSKAYVAIFTTRNMRYSIIVLVGVIIFSY